MKHLAPLSLLLLALAAAPRPVWAANRAAAPVGPPPVLLKPEAGGAFLDAAGKSHPWSVGQGHGLTWDGLPFLPVGVTVTPRSWARGAGAADWAADQAQIDALAKRGVRDVLLSAGARGLTRVPTSAVQRVLDYLDAHGFDYGLRIADVAQEPLTGYVVKPAVYRNPAPSASGPTRFRHIPALEGGFYLLVSPSTGEMQPSDIEEYGEARVADTETAEVSPKSGAAGDVLLLYPRRSYPPGTPESRLPDLWAGYDEYRDRLLGFFGRVRLGPGFRFFLDPITRDIGLGGEVANVVPDSDGFRLDFEAWLDKKYGHNVDDLNRGWGIKERDLPDFATAARCLPLWAGGKGVPAVWDPVKKAPYLVLTRPSVGGHVWDDLRQFRIDSVRGYMNALAGVLKKSVADVPVVYGWGGRSALFTPDARGGFDGLGVERAADAVYALAQAEDAPRTAWLLSASDAPLGADLAALSVPAPLTAPPPAAGLGMVGMGGYYAPALTDADVKRTAEYAAALSFGPAGPSGPARVLPYPAGLINVGASPRRLAGGVWWLPSYRAGALSAPDDAFTLGPTVRGYRLVDPDGRQPRFVLWSPRGAATQARFPFPKDSPALVTDAAGVPLAVAKKNGVWTVPLGEDPIVVSRVSSVPLPIDAAEAADKEAERLIKLAKDQGLSVDLFEQQRFQSKNALTDDAQNADLRYNSMARLVAELSAALQPYLWIEAEGASSYTFDSAVSDSEASSGSYLSLDTDRPPSTSGSGAGARDGDAGGGYHAEWQFRAGASGSYALWAATTPTRDSSPFTFTLDGGGANPVQDVTVEGGLYAGRFVWSRIGTVSLSRGPHTLSLNVTGPRARDGRYVLAVDALCLSRAPFHPNGAQPPAIEFLPPLDDKDKAKKPGKRRK